MDWLRKYSIRARLLFCMALVVFIGVSIGTGATLGLLSLRQGFEGLTQGELAAVSGMNRVSSAVARMRGAERDMIINAGDTVSIATLRKQWKAAFDEAGAALKPLGAQARDASTRAAAQEVDKRLQAYMQGIVPVVDMLESGTMGSASEAAQNVDAPRQEVQAAEAVLAKATEGARAAAEKRSAEVGQTITRAVVLLWVLLWAPGIVFLPLMWASIVSVVRPLQHAESVVTAIAQGDLAQRIDAGGRDEISQLLRSMQAMQSGLNRMVDAVRRSSADMLVASTEIAAGNQDLSSRTEQAAANLQQTTSSMEQLNRTVQESAQAAHGANELARRARTQAEHGGTVVGEVVANMDQISEASRKIGDIIGVIDNIAFQTNILALNAAVEAARAGEQGRGFAVVASEVRSLAHRSAAAAKEIKSLIGASVERVEVGSQRVRDAGTVMQEIVESIRSVTDSMSGIASATTAQSHDLGVVADAVISLDHMTQQNAALVEQSAAAADSLKQQANNLAGVVQRFRVDETTAG